MHCATAGIASILPTIQPDILRLTLTWRANSIHFENLEAHDIKQQLHMLPDMRSVTAG